MSAREDESGNRPDDPVDSLKMCRKTDAGTNLKEVVPAFFPFEGTNPGQSLVTARSRARWVCSPRRPGYNSALREGLCQVWVPEPSA